MIKKTESWLFTFVFLISCLTKVNAQPLGCPLQFTVTTTVAFPTVGSTNIIPSSGNTDEWDTLIAPINFSFTFCGQVYTKIVISTNGWLALVPAAAGPQVPPALMNPMPINELNNNLSGYPVIAPLWDDLATTLFSYNYINGSLWIRWTTKWTHTNAMAATTLFWVQLNSSDNSITFNYANNATYVPTTPGASIGISGINTGEYYSISPISGNTASIDSSVENATVGTGAPGCFRPFNVAYTFTPASGNVNVETTGSYSDRWISVNPNPGGHSIGISFFQKMSGKVNVSITDVTGRIILQSQAEVIPGINSLMLDVGHPGSGIYQVILFNTADQNGSLQTSFFIE